jgi:hypothetical protein
MHVVQVIWVGNLGVVAVDESMFRAEAHFITPEIENTPCFVGWLYCFKARKTIGVYSVSGKLPAFRANL